MNMKGRHAAAPRNSVMVSGEVKDLSREGVRITGKRQRTAVCRHIRVAICNPMVIGFSLLRKRHGSSFPFSVCTGRNRKVNRALARGLQKFPKGETTDAEIR